MIVITETRALSFGAVAANDVAYVQPPLQGAIFTITGGTANGWVTLLAPTAATSVNMVNGAGTIVANAFTGSPALGSCVTLDAAGAATIYVGATRAAPGAVVNSGNYSGTYTFTAAEKKKANCVGNLGGNVTLATPTATVKGVISISVTESTALNFGTVYSGDAPSVLAASSAPSCAGCVRGSFAVAGEPNQSYIVRAIPSRTIASGANTMTINPWSAACNGTSGSLVTDLPGCLLTAGGTDTVYVGGTLTIGATQAPGAYSGTYTLTVAYQ